MRILIKIHYNLYKKTPVKCDVLVAGGGPAGIAAAIAATRAGCRVVLLEKYGSLGGLASNGNVGTICGLYLPSMIDNAQSVCGGFAREFAEEISMHSGAKPVHAAEGLYVLPYDPWHFQRAADNLVRRAAGISVVLHGTLVSVDAGGSKVREVSALVWDRCVSFRPSCVVDCTGEATVLYMAGVIVDEDSENQAAAVIFSLDTFMHMEGRENSLALLRDIHRAVREKQLTPPCGAVSVVPCAGKYNGFRLKVNLPYEASTDMHKLSELELRARDIIDELSCFLKAKITQMPVQVGVRSGRRARGRSILTEDDILNCRKYQDGVACGAWPIEEWGLDIRPRMTYTPENEYYEIPIGCLIPESINNVFVAGRCISATARAIASARVIGISLCTGWAAGKAAAFQAMNRPLSSAVKEIREEQGGGRGHGS